LVYTYGDYSIKGILPGIGITLEAVGPITSATTTHSILILGESERGPTDLVGMTSALSAQAFYASGDLKEAIEDSFGEGAPRVFAKRILGAGNVIADVDLVDDQSSPNTVGTLFAKSAGAWGNANSCTVSQGVIKHAEQNYFAGNGLGGVYALEQANFINPQPSSGSVLVNGVDFDIVYVIENLAAGKVWLNCDTGELKFYVSDEPDAADQVVYSLWYYGVDVLITDNVTTEYREDIKDLDDLQDAFASSSLVEFVIAEGMTHLPAVARYVLIGGTDGATIDADDWEQALIECGNELKKLNVVPTTVALCSYEVQPNTYDLHVIASQWATAENTKFRPTVVFVPTAPSETPENMVLEGMKRSNRHLAIVYPSWDESERRKNLAVLHAARTAWAPLGESVAADENRLKGANGLHGDIEDTIHDDYVRSLTTRGIYVVVKTQAGVGPVKGITTDKLDQFSRVVDQVTANYIIVKCKDTMTPFLNRKNDADQREAMKTSVDMFLEELKMETKAIYDYVTVVTPDRWNPNLVHFLLKFIPMGHIEWVEVAMKMGPYTDLAKLQGA
jgi:hypothetical protein